MANERKTFGIESKIEEPKGSDLLVQAYLAAQRQESRAQVLALLENDIFDRDPRAFHDSLVLSRHPLMLTMYSVEDFAQMQTFKVPAHNIGFALKKVADRLEIVAVHNNEVSVKDIGRALVEAAIRQGGNALDHFGSAKLNELYGSLGFVEVSRLEFDPTYDPEGKFASIYGPLPVIYRVLDRK